MKELCIPLRQKRAYFPGREKDIQREDGCAERAEFPCILAIHVHGRATTNRDRGCRGETIGHQPSFQASCTKSSRVTPGSTHRMPCLASHKRIWRMGRTTRTTPPV